LHQRFARRRFNFGLLAAGTGLLLPRTARAVPMSLTLGLQTGGTAAWGVKAMQLLGLPDRHGLALSVRPLADSAAGQVALQVGAVDLILSDMVWVSMQRHRGSGLYFVPFSQTVGGLFAGPRSGIGSVAELKGQTLGVGGGPLDKNFIFLQAAYQHRTGRPLLPDITARYGAPPLINQLLLRGQVGAALNFWQWNARAQRAGAQQVISVAEMLAAMGIAKPPPLLGWTFTERLASRRAAALTGFFDASFEAAQHLLTDDAIWEQLQPEMAAGDDPGLFAALRDGYRAGIVSHYDPADIRAAEAAYAVLAKYGGRDLVGDASALATEMFWKGYHR
jgi:NitT/TauT family transport system substrate-binding protein